MPIACDRIQEEIAVSQTLPVATRAHIEGCPACKKVLEEYQSLERLFQQTLSEPTAGFTETVMREIEMPDGRRDTTRAPKSREWFRRFSAAQYAAYGIGAAVSAACMVRFVFYVLVPA